MEEEDDEDNIYDIANVDNIINQQQKYKQP